jgi:hypothetical protein
MTPTATAVVLHKAAAMPDRISLRQLQELETNLSDRDKDILRTIQVYRYLTTSQIQRLHVNDAASPSAALRATSRNLKKLKELHLIDSLPRRIGGVYSGSGSCVWHLDAAGEHLLRLNDKNARPHKASFEPSSYFVAHTLSVAECYVRLKEVCRKKGMRLSETQNEPYCWRPYNSAGKIISLKPDLFAITICDNYEDRWFFEIDLATESPIKITEKCRRYLEYYRSGLEQEQHKVFPLVVWIVPDAARKSSIELRIKAEFSKQPNIFTVITPNEFESMVRMGAVDIEGDNS